MNIDTHLHSHTYQIEQTLALRNWKFHQNQITEMIWCAAERVFIDLTSWAHKSRPISVLQHWTQTHSHTQGAQRNTFDSVNLLYLFFLLLRVFAISNINYLPVQYKSFPIAEQISRHQSSLYVCIGGFVGMGLEKCVCLAPKVRHTGNVYWPLWQQSVPFIFWANRCWPKRWVDSLSDD